MTLIVAIILAICLQWSSAIVLEGERYSYARYPPWNGCTEASFSFDFKTTQNGDAILWYADDLGGTDFFYVGCLLMINCYCFNSLFINCDSLIQYLLIVIH